MATELPRRHPGSARRRRGIDLPTAAGVPTVRVASDPGVRVPDFGRFAGGAEAFGKGLEVFGAAAHEAAARQTKQFDALKTAKAEIEYKRLGTFEVERLDSENTDYTNPRVITDHEEFFESLREQTEINLRDDGVSEPAIQRSLLRMEQTRNAFIKNLGVKSLAALNTQSEAAIDLIINGNAADAHATPGAVEDVLTELALELGEFGGLGKEKLAAARAQVIEAAIQGHIGREEIELVPALLERYADDLTPKTQQALRKSLPALRKKQLENAINAFVEGQPDFTTAFSKLRNGEFDDPVLKEKWNRLGATDRLDLMSKILKRASAVHSFNRALDGDDDRQDERLRNELRVQFYMSDNPAEQKVLRDRLTKLGESASTIRTMNDWMGGRVTFSTTPNPALEADLLRELEEGSIGPDDLRARQGDMDREGFFRVMTRARIVQRRGVADQFRRMDRVLGIPSVPAQFPTQEQIDLAAEAETLKAELQDWAEDHPDASLGEIREQSRLIVEKAGGRVKQNLDEKALKRIATIGGLIEGFDIKEPEQSLKALITSGDLRADDAKAKQILRAINAAKKRGVLK